jgi:hypothetical protein
MAGYLLLLLLVQSYTWLICRTRRLANGTAVGFAGWVWGIALAVMVAPGSFPRLPFADSLPALEPGGHLRDLAHGATQQQVFIE